MKRKATNLEVRIEYRAVPDEESARRLAMVFDLLLKESHDKAPMEESTEDDMC
jgi:ribosome-binding protein aMBF1 (putative translation factor)